MLNVLLWLGLAEAVLLVGLGLFGQELLYLPAGARPFLWAVAAAGIVFGVYCWFSARKSLVAVVTEAILTIAAANLVISVAWARASPHSSSGIGKQYIG